jgi:hypothetical protein
LQLTSRRSSGLGPLAVFVGSVLLMDAVAIGSVAVLMSRGHIVGDWISFYTGGTLVRTGSAAHLYDASAQAAVQRQLFGSDIKTMGYPLPVFVAFLFAPLTRLSFVASYLVWLAVNLALLGVLLRLSWRWLERVPQTLRAVFLVCAVSVTALEVLMQGQVDLFVLAGFAGCYALLRADRPFTAGALLTLALCKPHLAVAVLLLLLVKGQWRAIAGFAAVGVPLLIGPALVVGPHLLVDQVRLVLSYTNTATAYDVSAAMMINIRGTVTSLTGSSNVWLWLPLLVLIAAVAFYVAVRIWIARPTLHPQSWALAFTLPLLYSPHIHAQSLVLLLAAAGLYLVDSQSSDRPIVDIKYVLAGLVAITMLWSLSLSGLALMAFLVLAAYALFSQRWPQPAAEAATAPLQVELALAS